ncbi:hypothetical protein ACO0LD_14410 [Undibacterium sp. Ji83W]|uniref:hypothetical protein n=1 Tax=Undibacterium sp. Ji83W TaxID=3413043 RepID=UPI003BF06287
MITEKKLVSSELDPLVIFAPEEPGLQWQKISGMAVLDEASLSLEVCRMQCMTLAEAKAFAATDDRITFFFYVKHYAIMYHHHVLHAGDVIFFSGAPALHAEPGADCFEKPAAPDSKLSITAAPGNNWISIQAQVQVPFLNSDKAHAYLWPCLRPGQDNSAEWMDGGLQAVLSYSPVQNTGINAVDKLNAHGGWWVCGQYVHAGGRQKPAQACFGGPSMPVSPGDILSCRIVYDVATRSWLQTITNTMNKNSVSFPVSVKHKHGQTHEKNTVSFCLEKLTQAYHGQAEHSHLYQCLSLFNVIAKARYPQNNLGHGLNNLPHVDHASLSDDQTSLHIARIILYSPMLDVR